MVKRKRKNSGISFAKSNKFLCQECRHFINTSIFEGFKNGDILRVEKTNGKHEYMIYEDCEDEKLCPRVFYAVAEELYEPPPETWSESISQWLFGPKEMTWIEIPERLDKNKRIDVKLDCANIVLQSRKFQKYNVADECLTSNDPNTIIERAKFKYFNGSYPQFQTDKDWAIWCRYGKDIVACIGTKY